MSRTVKLTASLTIDDDCKGGEHFACPATGTVHGVLDGGGGSGVAPVGGVRQDQESRDDEDNQESLNGSGHSDASGLVKCPGIINQDLNYLHVFCAWLDLIPP